MADYLDDPQYGIGRVVEANDKIISIEFPSLGKERKKFRYRIVQSRISPESDLLNKQYKDEVEKYVRTLNERFKNELKERKDRSARSWAPTNKSLRTTHCWSCKKPIDSESDFVCPDCDGIICPRDGACFCGWT